MNEVQFDEKNERYTILYHTNTNKKNSSANATNHAGSQHLPICFLKIELNSSDLR